MAIAMLIFTPPAQAQYAAVEAQPLQPYNDTGLYDIFWKGLSVGKLVISATESRTAYEMTLITRTSGVAWLATRHKSTMAMQGIVRNGSYWPGHFETDFKLRKDNRQLSLDFDTQSGQLTGESNTPEEPEWKRPKVPSSLKANITDPLTTFFAMRPLVFNALKHADKPGFTLRYYDARRLTDLHFSVLGREVTALAKKKQAAVVRVAVTRTAIAGYKENELEEIAEGDDIRLQLLLSDDGRLLPLRIIAHTSFGDVYIDYQQACPSLDACWKLIE